MPTHNRQYLERRIAYRIQEIDLAKRGPGALERHKARIDGLLDATKPKAKAGRGEFVKFRRPDLYAQVRLAKGAWGCTISQ